MGKLIAEARGEVDLSADIIDYYATNAERFLAPQHLAPATGEAAVESSPLGVLFGVQPWNFPYYQLARFAAPNLMAGNVVMVKHASCVPQCALLFAALWRDAGAPAGAYTNLLISHAQVDRVIDDPRIKGVALTGSVEAGRSVAARAGRNLKKSTMELGGSDAFIVLADADLDQAVRWALWGRMNNTGQCCVAAKRFIVVEAVADRFLAGFRAALAALKPGDPMNPATTLGPLSTEAALLTLVDQVDRAVAAGATAVMGGHRIDRPGSFMQPTILTGITRDNPAFDEEFFGPVALLFRVADEDAAVALANDSPFGLGGSVFTADVARGKRVAARIETGMVFINHPTWTAPDLPFGGVKDSSYGREAVGHGHPGVREQEAGARRRDQRRGLDPLFARTPAMTKDTTPPTLSRTLPGDAVWLVTGCSTGFGRELARQALAQGYRVAVTARDPAEVEDLAGHGEALVLKLDVTDPAEIAAAVAATQERFGRIDVLVNNAGIGYFAAVEEGEDREVRRMFDINVFGLTHMIQAVLPAMRGRRSGCIVNVSSIGGLRSFPAIGYYNADQVRRGGPDRGALAGGRAAGHPVMLVEPSGFRTDWAGRSAHESKVEIADYAATAGVARQGVRAVSGKQAGDPVRAMEAVVRVVASGAPRAPPAAGQRRI